MNREAISTSTGALRLEAPAKLNLNLSVVGRTDDGYHLLESDLVLLDLADRLLLAPGSSGLRVEGNLTDDVPLDADNLAWRGLGAGLGEEPQLTCLILEKRIPSRAGLGGGSSDAAAAWRLGRAWRGAADPPTEAELGALAGIGADVPFFASALPAAHVSGMGERVAPSLPAPISHVTLVHPPFGLSTAAVFAELRADEWGQAENDLLAPALRLRPELGDVMRVVSTSGGRPRLTGSGPTIFAIGDDPDRAEAVADAVRSTGLRATVTRTRRAAASIEPFSEEE